MIIRSSGRCQFHLLIVSFPFYIQVKIGSIGTLQMNLQIVYARACPLLFDFDFWRFQTIYSKFLLLCIPAEDSFSIHVSGIAQLIVIGYIPPYFFICVRTPFCRHSGNPFISAALFGGTIYFYMRRICYGYFLPVDADFLSIYILRQR